MNSEEKRISDMVHYWVNLEELREGRTYYSLPMIMRTLEDFVR